MKTIERLRALIARVKESPKAFTAKEMDDWSAADAEVYAVLPALLAVAEAQAAEIAAWREMHESEGSTEDHGWGQLEKVNKCEEATDAAIRALEGGD